MYNKSAQVSTHSALNGYVRINVYFNCFQFYLALLQRYSILALAWANLDSFWDQGWLNIFYSI